MQDSLLLIDTDAFCGEGVFAHFFAKMPPERQKKIDAFKFDRDKRLSLGAGVLLETVAAQAGAGELCYGEKGKPFFAQGSDERFTQLWTIKESVMKFFGQGVGISPKKISIGFEPRVCVTTEGYDSGGLRFCVFAGQDFALTVCSQSEEFCKGVTQVCIGEDFELQTSGFDGAQRVY